MCTIGAIHLNDNETLLFKNKDFAETGFNDRLALNEAYFGPQGLETFDVAGKEAVFSGLSLGVNQHGLMACVNHVKNTGRKAMNYDLLVEHVVRDCRDVESAVTTIQTRLDDNAYWWGNIVLADKNQTAVVEVRDSVCRFTYATDNVFRTNHQPLFGEDKSPDGITCSGLRYQSASQRLDCITDIEQLFTLLSSHDSEDGQTGICNHSSSLKTVYAYVLHRIDDKTYLYVCQGNPCSNTWQKLLVPVGEDWSDEAERGFLSDYPTGLNS